MTCKRSEIHVGKINPNPDTCAHIERIQSVYKSSDSLTIVTS